MQSVQDCERCRKKIETVYKFDGKFYCCNYCAQREWAIGQALKHHYQSGYSF